MCGGAEREGRSADCGRRLLGVGVRHGEEVMVGVALTVATRLEGELVEAAVRAHG